MEGSSALADQDSAEGEGGKEGGEKKKKKGKSQYLINREKNIEKNRELLAPFFKEVSEAINDWKEEEQAIKKKKKEGKITKAEKKKGKGNRSTQISKE